MRLLLIHASTFEALWVRQHLASLCRQGGQTNLSGFLASRHPAQRSQAKRDARRLLRLAHPVLLGHTDKRCDRIRTDRQSDLLET